MTNEDCIEILKSLHRRMQAKEMRLLQLSRTKSSPVLLYRSYSYTEACAMIEHEIEALGGHVNVRGSRTRSRRYIIQKDESSK